MATIGTYEDDFKGYPILGWAIDDWQQFDNAIKSVNPNFSLKNYKESYIQNSFNNIVKLFDNAPLKLNLGGKTEKSKLTTTDKPMGIFDFSLASRGMYKVPEYYSEKLAIEFPNKFKELELPSGIVPNNLIKQNVENGEKVFYYEDDNGIFNCEIRQKGKTAIEDGVVGAKLKYATRNKKVYLTHKRNKGKVKYVEIYSLFYFTSLDSDVQFAVRHIPAIMLAEYLESIGVMTRIYMTRFVQLNNDWKLKEETNEGVKLPMYEKSPNKEFSTSLFVQPILAKDFAEQFDKALAFMISSDNFREVFKSVSKWSITQEVTKKRISDDELLGNPNFSQNRYFEGIERYRNKYQEYVKLGLFKSKEVLPEAMLFFHDMVIKTRFYQFMREVRAFTDKSTDADILVDVNINPFFNWWMRLSATILKHKVELVNSNELKKDLLLMYKEIENFITELNEISINAKSSRDTSTQTLTAFLKNLGTKILEPQNPNEQSIAPNTSENCYGYSIIDFNGKMIFKKYITNIMLEVTTYAEGILFETDQDRIEVRENLATSVLNELVNF